MLGGVPASQLAAFTSTLFRRQRRCQHRQGDSQHAFGEVRLDLLAIDVFLGT
jgi:hypothetical protein